MKRRMFLIGAAALMVSPVKLPKPKEEIAQTELAMGRFYITMETSDDGKVLTTSWVDEEGKLTGPPTTMNLKYHKPVSMSESSDFPKAV